MTQWSVGGVRRPFLLPFVGFCLFRIESRAEPGLAELVVAFALIGIA